MGSVAKEAAKKSAWGPSSSPSEAALTSPSASPAMSSEPVAGWVRTMSWGSVTEKAATLGGLGRLGSVPRATSSIMGCLGPAMLGESPPNPSASWMPGVWVSRSHMGTGRAVR